MSAINDEVLRHVVEREVARCGGPLGVGIGVELAMRCCRIVEELHGITHEQPRASGNDTISVEHLPPGSVLLRVIEPHKPSRRHDGKPPFVGTTILVPSRDDRSIGHVVGLLLLESATKSKGWRRKLEAALIDVARQLGYRRLMADTGGRRRAGWHAVEGDWIGYDVDSQPIEP